MANENTGARTIFDSATQSHQLEIIKAAIPYINNSGQRAMSVFVKASELAETVSLFQRPDAGIGITAQSEGSKNPMDMLNDIKAVCTGKEQETVNMIINYFNAFQLYRTYHRDFGGDNVSQPNSGNAFQSMKELLTPDQQKMFETYSLMFNSK
ncbi:hypothetical protein [Konateibacter massiliensis]|uniref:hypothetical protein n=1 Tax=Konateibacter massiliensis TaxID=2002841 RepID=UPI000C159058|nr:hypothetical protein [Konateibacter massiliensis]